MGALVCSAGWPPCSPMPRDRSLSFIFSPWGFQYSFIGLCLALLIVNIVKIPFMADLEIITWESMSVSWWMFVPAVAGFLAPFLVKCINQTLERLVWLFIVIAGIRML